MYWRCATGVVVALGRGECDVCWGCVAWLGDDLGEPGALGLAEVAAAWAAGAAGGGALWVAGEDEAGEDEAGAGAWAWAAAGAWPCSASLRLMRFLRFMEMLLLRLTWGSLDEPVIHVCARICHVTQHAATSHGTEPTCCVVMRLLGSTMSMLRIRSLASAEISCQYRSSNSNLPAMVTHAQERQRGGRQMARYLERSGRGRETEERTYPS